jgi:hypothetical protein
MFIKLMKSRAMHLFSLNVNKRDGLIVDALPCNKQKNQAWTWNSRDGSVQNNHNGRCLTVSDELEVWAGPLSDGSQAVVLLSRAHSGNDTITVQWTDLGFPSNHSALVRDLWARKDLGVFTGNYTSPPIEYHSSTMLKVTLTDKLTK